MLRYAVERPPAFMSLDELQQLGADLEVGDASDGIGFTLAGRVLDRGGEELLNPFRAARIHLPRKASRPTARQLRLSHARENAQSRLTVAGDVPRAAAVSSTDIPPKQRHSTTRQRRSFIASSRSSVSSKAIRSPSATAISGTSVSGMRTASPPRLSRDLAPA